MANKVLETKDLTMRFGGLVAVNCLDLYVDEGEAVGLIGPNGAGKTTAFNMISGAYKPSDGKVFSWVRIPPAFLRRPCVRRALAVPSRS